VVPCGSDKANNNSVPSVQHETVSDVTQSPTDVLQQTVPHPFVQVVADCSQLSTNLTDVCALIGADVGLIAD